MSEQLASRQVVSLAYANVDAIALAQEYQVDAIFRKMAEYAVRKAEAIVISPIRYETKFDTLIRADVSDVSLHVGTLDEVLRDFADTHIIGRPWRDERKPYPWPLYGNVGRP